MTIVSNPSADAEEKIDRAAKILKASKQNREVFKIIYSGGKFKTIQQIKSKVTKSNTNTYKAAQRLYGDDIVEKKVSGKVISYGKKDFYRTHRDKILRLASNPKRLKEYPTKIKVQVKVVSQNSYTFRTKPQVKQIYIDDIDSFKKVKAMKTANASTVQKMAERTINDGICSILNQTGKKDWGGERNDIYSNKILLRSKRKSAAFALKGKAIKTKLVPGKMGKNGDQIQRLFETTADIYLVVHNREIDDRVVDLMQKHALQKSIANNKQIYFCIIDGDDLARLFVAYPKEFGLSNS